MQNKNGGLDKMVDRVGWGLFLILIGGLFLAQNRGWLQSDGWSYFAIGLGSIFTLGGLIPFLVGQGSRWSAAGRIICGLAIIYVGVVFLYGFGSWWPLAIIPIGVGYLVRATWGNKPESYIQ
jgi:hypothetical protein